MILSELKTALEEIKSPLLHSRNTDAMQRVFAIYTAVTGREPRGVRCFQCAIDAYFELKKITTSGEGWDNSVNLIPELKQLNKKPMSNLKKYKMLTTSFRMFGSPDTLTIENATDEKIDAILKLNPQFEKFFQLIEKPEKKVIETETLPELNAENHLNSETFEVPKMEKITKKKGGRLPKKTI